MLNCPKKSAEGIMKNSKFKIEIVDMTVKQLMCLSRKIEETSTFIDNIENDNFLIDLLIHIFFPDRGVPAEFFKIGVEQLGLKII